MKNEITAVDVKKINEELEYRKYTLRQQLHDEVKRTREYGDLSENDEYRTAKRERNRNESRIRYLDRLLLTATVVEVRAKDDRVGLFSLVTYRNEKTGQEKCIQIVTALRQNALKGFISKDSPLGRAFFGRRAGDTVRVEISPENTYTATILAVRAGEDNDDLPISSY